ncbi:ADP-ribosylglycohydrolase family protein [soil metagenome]
MPDADTDKIIGCLVGAAVGDALGLPFEGLTPARRMRMFSDVQGYRFILRHGMASDDTEHLCMTAQSLLASRGDHDRFARSLGWRLRFWILALPAGVGFATLRACIKLWLGWPASRSGIHSAGNGPAMRSAILGVIHLDDSEMLKSLVRASTRVTHTDPRAETGALIVAVAAGCAAWDKPFFPTLEGFLPATDHEFHEAMRRVRHSIESGQTTQEFAVELGLERGVTGYILHTVPLSIHAWLRNKEDFRRAVTEVISCGGDTDTTAAITGAIVGSRTGLQGIPADLIGGYCDYPRSINWIKRLGERVADYRTGNREVRPLGLAFYFIPIRNLIFLFAVLAHGLRRLVPL